MEEMRGSLGEDSGSEFHRMKGNIRLHFLTFYYHLLSVKRVVVARIYVPARLNAKSNV